MKNKAMLKLVGALGLLVGIEACTSLARYGEQMQVFTPISADFLYNGRNDTLGAGHGFTRRDAMASFPLVTDATTLTFTGKTNIDAQWVTGTRMAVYVDGKFFSVYTFAKPHVEEDFVVTGLPVGTKLVEIYEGAQGRQMEQGEVQIQQLVRVAVPTRFTAQVPARVKKKACAIILSNSRSIGGGVDIPVLSSFPRLLGRQRDEDVFVLGYASLQMGVHIVGAAAQQKLLAELTERAAGYSTVRIVLGDSENDWGGAYTPEQLQTAYQTLLPAIHRALPTAKVYLIGTIPDRGNVDAPNKLGFLQADYRNVELTVGASMPWVRGMDCTKAGLEAADYKDLQHLNESGERKIATFVNQCFDKD